MKTKIASAGKAPTDTESADIAQTRKRLETRLAKWRASQFTRFPALHTAIADTIKLSAEDQRMLLPSDFPLHQQRSALGLMSLVLIERSLREAEGRDSLHAVKEALKREALSVKFKQKESRGQKDCTRANDVIRAHAASKRKAVAKYRHARSAHIALLTSLPFTAAALLPELKDTDLTMKQVDTPHTLGDGSTGESWIWTYGTASANSQQSGLSSEGQFVRSCGYGTH